MCTADWDLFSLVLNMCWISLRMDLGGATLCGLACVVNRSQWKISWWQPCTELVTFNCSRHSLRKNSAQQRFQPEGRQQTRKSDFSLNWGWVGSRVLNFFRENTIQCDDCDFIEDLNHVEEQVEIKRDSICLKQTRKPSNKKRTTGRLICSTY